MIMSALLGSLLYIYSTTLLLLCPYLSKFYFQIFEQIIFSNFENNYCDNNFNKKFVMILLLYITASVGRSAYVHLLVFLLM